MVEPNTIIPALNFLFLDTNKMKRMKAIPSVDFNPHDDLILNLLNDSGKYVYHIVMTSGEEKWFSGLDYIHFN